MISKYTYKNITWIDLEAPTKEETTSLLHEYLVPTTICDELLTQTVRSKVDMYDKFIYLILHFPSGIGKEIRRPDQEVDFVITEDLMITVHYEPVNGLHDFAKKFEMNSLIDKGMTKAHAGVLFYQLLKELYKHTTNDLEDLNQILRQIEKRIFHGKETEMVKTISNTNRHIIDYKQALRFHREVLESFEAAGLQQFGNGFSYYTTAILSEYNKIQRIVDGHKEILNDLRDTNDSLLSVKTGHAMKTLTMMSFVIFPLSLIAGIFGMNAQHMPIIGHSSDFWIVLGIMGCATLIMFTFFKIKRWI